MGVIKMYGVACDYCHKSFAVKKDLATTIHFARGAGWKCMTDASGHVVTICPKCKNREK
jgi:hypothetical protein